jgi:hypothetical protein
MFETEVGDEIAVTGIGVPAEYIPTPALVMAAIFSVYATPGFRPITVQLNGVPVITQAELVKTLLSVPVATSS